MAAAHDLELGMVSECRFDIVCLLSHSSQRKKAVDLRQAQYDVAECLVLFGYPTMALVCQVTSRTGTFFKELPKEVVVSFFSSKDKSLAVLLAFSELLYNEGRVEPGNCFGTADLDPVTRHLGYQAILDLQKILKHKGVNHSVA